MTRFLLDTSTVSAAMWKVPDPSVLRSELEELETLAAVGSSDDLAGRIRELAGSGARVVGAA